MLKQISVVAATVALAVGPVDGLAAQERPDFSGTWVIEEVEFEGPQGTRVAADAAGAADARAAGAAGAAEVCVEVAGATRAVALPEVVSAVEPSSVRRIKRAIA